MALIAKLKAALADRRDDDLARYRALLEAGESLEEARVEELREVMTRLGKTPEDAEKDAGLLAKARELEALAAQWEEAEAERQKAQAAWAAAQKKYDRTVARLKEAVSKTKVAWSAAQARAQRLHEARRDLAALKRRHPELFGQGGA